MSIAFVKLAIMNIQDDYCIELEEIFCQLTMEFWKQSYRMLLGQIGTVEQDEKVSKSQAIKLFCKELKKICLNKKYEYKKSKISKTNSLEITFCLITVYINLWSGEITVSTIQINSMKFQYSEWKAALEWIQNYINIDMLPLSELRKSLKEELLLNTKATEIVQISIKTICNTFCEMNKWQYKIVKSRLKSDVYIQKTLQEKYQITVYHKAFSRDSSSFINLLKDPKELYVRYTIFCQKLDEKWNFGNIQGDSSQDEIKRLKEENQKILNEIMNFECRYH